MTPSPQEVAALVQEAHDVIPVYRDKELTLAADLFARMADALTAQAARIAELERECAELRKDAARLGFMEATCPLMHHEWAGDGKHGTTVLSFFGDDESDPVAHQGETLRSAIDAAMTAKPTEGRT